MHDVRCISGPTNERLFSRVDALHAQTSYAHARQLSTPTSAQNTPQRRSPASAIQTLALCTTSPANRPNATNPLPPRHRQEDHQSAFRAPTQQERRHTRAPRHHLYPVLPWLITCGVDLPELRAIHARVRAQRIAKHGYAAATLRSGGKWDG
jgi:hypothetical protein